MDPSFFSKTPRRHFLFFAETASSSGPLQSHFRATEKTLESLAEFRLDTTSEHETVDPGGSSHARHLIDDRN